MGRGRYHADPEARSSRETSSAVFWIRQDDALRSFTGLASPDTWEHAADFVHDLATRGWERGQPPLSPGDGDMLETCLSLMLHVTSMRWAGFWCRSESPGHSIVTEAAGALWSRVLSEGILGRHLAHRGRRVDA